MKREYLQDYQAKERDDFERFKKKIQSQGLAPDDRYPSLQRLDIAHQPIAYSVGSTYRLDNEKIWSQIPFPGTLVIPLQAYDKDHMLECCGFEASDIQKLITLAKDTGRVRFGLADPPEYFENMEHFDPIFTELKPPELLYMPDEALPTDQQTVDDFRKEFEDLANVNYYGAMVRESKNEGFSENEFLSLIDHRKDTFVFMKILGMEEVANEISQLMITDVPHADALLAAYEYLIEPIFDPLKASKNFSLSEIQYYNYHYLASKIPSSTQQNFDVRSFPVEIGRFITKKLVACPSSYSGCNAVIQHYEQNELYKVLEALDNAIKSKKQDDATIRISELNEIMDNAWKGANKVELSSEGVKYGITLAVGCVGLLVIPPLGVLASLSFLAGDKALSIFEKSIAYKIARSLNKQYLVNIYDFKLKYNLK
jgi:hypothetical protein